jgi:predicted dehydrogenase
VGIEEPRHRRSVVTGFIEAIQKGKPVPIPGEEALITTRVLDAIYESAEKGKEVRIAG